MTEFIEMPETISSNRDMVVVLRRHRSILVPPFELARDEIQHDENIQQAAMRISREYGPMMDLDAEIPIPEIENAPTHAYLVENYRFLTGSEFLVLHRDVPQAVKNHDYLSPLEKHLLVSAANLLDKIK